MNDFQFIRLCLNLALFNGAIPESVSFPEDWSRVYSLCSCHGIMGHVLEGMNRLGETTCPMDVHRKMAASVIVAEEKFEKNLKTGKMVAEYFHKNNVRMAVLKGFAFSTFFPKPKDRICTDLDCFLFDDYEKGNKLIEAKNIKVDRFHYKHSSFRVNALTFENHHFCTPIRGSKEAKDNERALQSLLKEERSETMFDSRMICPGPVFNAIFMLEHARGHFLREGLGLRHFLDWVMLNRAIPEDFDREKYQLLLKSFGLEFFAATFDSVAKYIVGEKDALSEIEKRVLEDTLSNTESIKYRNGIKTRIQIVKRSFSAGWKYKYFSRQSMISWLLSSAFSLISDRNPQL